MLLIPISSSIGLGVLPLFNSISKALIVVNLVVGKFSTLAAIFKAAILNYYILLLTASVLSSGSVALAVYLLD